MRCFGFGWDLVFAVTARCVIIGYWGRHRAWWLGYWRRQLRGVVGLFVIGYWLLPIPLNDVLFINKL